MGPDDKVPRTAAIVEEFWHISSMVRILHEDICSILLGQLMDEQVTNFKIFCPL
jgi:hypothetical protein